MRAKTGVPVPDGLIHHTQPGVAPTSKEPVSWAATWPLLVTNEVWEGRRIPVSSFTQGSPVIMPLNDGSCPVPSPWVIMSSLGAICWPHSRLPGGVRIGESDTGSSLSGSRAMRRTDLSGVSLTSSRLSCSGDRLGRRLGQSGGLLGQSKRSLEGPSAPTRVQRAGPLLPRAGLNWYKFRYYIYI